MRKLAKKLPFRKKAIVLLVIAVFLVFSFAPANAKTKEDKFPRLANIFLCGRLIDKSEYEQLAKFDLLILAMESQYYEREFMSYARGVNPDIIILAYIPSQSIHYMQIDDPTNIRKNLLNGIDPGWYLYDTNGNKINTWAEHYGLNVNSGWNQYLPRYVHDKIMSTGMWDGIFYDIVDPKISFVNNGDIDMNRDRVRDSANYADQQWVAGMTKLLENSRRLEGPSKIIIANGSSISQYQSNTNGRMFESFPTPWEGSGGWEDTIDAYFHLPSLNLSPQIYMINGSPEVFKNQSDYQKMRYSLASSLLGNGYFSYDAGPLSHAEIWWYDEYDAYLGLPKSDPINLTGSSEPIKKGLWKREFQNGMVLINSSEKKAVISFDEEYEKIKGIQNSQINDGSIINFIEIEPHDGIILLRPIEKIVGSPYTNGSFARVFNQSGQSVRNGFFAYFPLEKGGDKILEKDLDGDGSNEIIVANDSEVYIYKNKILYKTFYPYGYYYNRGINLAIGDLDNNGTLEIVTGTERGGGPHIRIFNSDGKLINPGWFAYAPNFRGGVNVAVGDLNGDGYNEVIAGAGYGGGPHVRVFNGNGKLINPGFFAYDPGFRGGVNVAVGDVNGDGKAEIVTGSGYGGAPQVRIFNNNGKLINPGWYAYNQTNRDGVEVIVNDVDNNGIAEIIATTTNVFTTSFY